MLTAGEKYIVNCFCVYEASIGMFAAIILSTAFVPPPPTPTILIRADDSGGAEFVKLHLSGKNESKIKV